MLLDSVITYPVLNSANRQAHPPAPATHVPSGAGLPRTRASRYAETVCRRLATRVDRGHTARFIPDDGVIGIGRRALVSPVESERQAGS